MNKKAIVTGGIRGIGKAIAIALHNNGYKVIANYVNDDKAAINFHNDTGILVSKWDVSDFFQCQNKVEELTKELGGNIDILVNNAGITRDGMLHKQSYDNWLAVINTNLNSVFNMTRCVIEGMRSNGFGRVINISSVNANGMIGQTNYSAAKAGIEGFTKALAQEVGRVGITANCIAPGYMDTEMVAKIPQDVLENIIKKVPANRLGKPEEIASVALFLAGHDSAFINGAVIPVNGGLRT